MPLGQHGAHARRQVQRVSCRAVDDRAQQFARCDQSLRTHLPEEAHERLLRSVRLSDPEHQHRGLVPDPERTQPPPQLGLVEVALDHLIEHVAGEPALRVLNDPAAHQLERHHRDRLLEDQALELAQAATVADRNEPHAWPARLGCDRQCERAAHDLVMGRLEGHGPSGFVALGRLGTNRLRRRGRNLAAEGRGCHQGAVRVE